ncbi:amino-acid N-acetyltransferase [Kocuria sp. ZOR0020]|uniref:amino-acid N-acetyltransferase n=1 Tax=Kocuria sp. ZOR0020 TaxID=1339234 RepID=UPI00068F61E5|nr:amino-acid N-acetyltransferase [Kocuria sp. ZOR0020]
MTSEIRLRPATTQDVPGIKALVTPLAHAGVLVIKETVAYYEGIQDFLVAEMIDDDGATRLVGCGALHVMWGDLAEIRTLATDSTVRGRGIGGKLVTQLLERARDLGVDRVFCLTFEVSFFRGHGFEVMPNQDQIDPEVFAELLRSQDEGVAEYLDLARVKPNTLGNTRMIRNLSARPHSPSPTPAFPAE